MLDESYRVGPFLGFLGRKSGFQLLGEEGQYGEEVVVNLRVLYEKEERTPFPSASCWAWHP